SLARQWVVRYAFEKLLVGDLTLSPGPGATRDLFAWERIALPDTSLPTPRIFQGSMASFVLIACLSMVGLDAGKAATIRNRLASAAVDPACALRPPRGTIRAQASDLPLGEAQAHAQDSSGVLALASMANTSTETRDAYLSADPKHDSANNFTWLDRGDP